MNRLDSLVVTIKSLDGIYFDFLTSSSHGSEALLLMLRDMDEKLEEQRG